MRIRITAPDNMLRAGTRALLTGDELTVPRDIDRASADSLVGQGLAELVEKPKRKRSRKAEGE